MSGSLPMDQFLDDMLKALGEYLPEQSYVFSWDKIPGKDNGRLLKYLTKNFVIDWVKTAKIEKIDNGKTIKVSAENNFLSLKLNDIKTEVILEIDDVRTNNFIAKTENDELNIYPTSASSLLKSGISIASLKERSLAVGNSRGMQSLASFDVVELKGGRLEAVVRFQLWSKDPDALEKEIAALHGRLLAAKNELWNAGILRLAAEETSPSEQVNLNDWRETADYRVLYEFHYSDTEGAESLITRIPIDIDSQHNESTVVSGEIVRWDNTATPALEVHGKIQGDISIKELFILFHLPAGWDGSNVTISASVGNGVPLEAKFNSVREFSKASKWEKWESEAGGSEFNYKKVMLGTKTYFAGRLAFPNVHFPNPIKLKEQSDLFRISYDAPPFDGDAVVYLRLIS